MESMNLASLAQTNLSMPEGDFYKFTNLNTFFKNVLLNNSPASENKFPASHFPTITIENGKVSPVDLKIPGVRITEISDNQFTGRVHPLSYLETHASKIQITIDKNITIPHPILISYKGEGHSAILINVSENSKVTLIEEIGATQGLTLTSAQLNLSAGAKVEHIHINDLSENALFHGSTSAEVSKDAIYRNVVFHLAGQLNRRNLDLKLNEAGGHGESFNLYLTNKNEHSDINTIIEHKSADSTSNQLAKGILDNESKCVFTGKIHIHPKSQRVASAQLNKNLILSKKAQAHSQPQLEIFADDVKCSHGSTTGQLSADELFYFEARGIPRERARTLLAHGFGLEVVMKIENKAAQERVSSLILNKLKTKFQLGQIL